MNRRHFVKTAAMLPAVASTCLTSMPTASAAKATANWRRAAPLPLKVQEIYPTVHDNRLYVAGGIGARLGVPYFTNRCVSFNASSNRWREESGLPESLHHVALASIDSRLFAVGGFNGGYTHIWRMRARVYQLVDNAWVTGIDLPAPQAEGVLAPAVSGRLHLVTGLSPRGEANSARGDHQETHAHWVLNPGAPLWESAAPIPTARNSATGAWIDNQLIVTGGRTSAANLAVTEIYDANEDRWRSGQPLPLPQAGTASTVVGSSLYLFGGEIFQPKAAVFANAWEYRLASDSWHALPPLPTPRHGLGAGLLGGEIFVVAGATKPSGRGTSDLNEALQVVQTNAA